MSSILSAVYDADVMAIFSFLYFYISFTLQARVQKLAFVSLGLLLEILFNYEYTKADYSSRQYLLLHKQNIPKAKQQVIPI